jgi:hypothetical protein
MQRRPILARMARALLSLLGALMLVVLAAGAEAEMNVGGAEGRRYRLRGL